MTVKLISGDEVARLKSQKTFLIPVPYSVHNFVARLLVLSRIERRPICNPIGDGVYWRVESLEAFGEGEPGKDS